MKLFLLGELYIYIYFNYYYFGLFVVEDRKILELLNDIIMMKLFGEMFLEIGLIFLILIFNDLINGKFVIFFLLV